MNFKKYARKKMITVWRYVCRNSRILSSKSRRLQKGKVNLHWWSRHREDGKENVGDYLSKVVSEYMVSQKDLSFDMDIGETRNLYAVGSIIQGGAQHATIWGSGLKNGIQDIPRYMHLLRRLDIRLVRGPRTREVLNQRGYSCPEKYGDPAILMPLIYTPKLTDEKDKSDYLVILHHESKLDIPGCLSPVTDDYKSFIDAVCSTKKVISSSLHGIILAETYGIHAVMLEDMEALENHFKFDDYYYSTGRMQYPVAETVEEAIRMKPLDIPDFTAIRKDIIDTFPYDLWEKRK